MNLDRLSLGEKILGVSGLALFVISFAAIWVKVEADVPGFSETARGNAWDGYGFLVKLGLVLALVGAVLVVTRAANANLALPYGNLYRGIAGATLVLMVLALVIGPDETGADEFGVEISRGIGLFLGALLSAGMAVGAWLHTETPAATTTSPDAAPA